MISDEKPQATAKPEKRRWQTPAAIAIGAFLVLLSPFWAPVFLKRMAFFRVRHIEVVGAHYLQPRDILDRLGVDTLASVWDPTGPLEQRVARHPLVREVKVDRKLPGTLLVRLVEHAPVALVSTTNGFRAYDQRGVPLPIDPTAAEVDAPILARPDTAVFRLLGALRSDAPELYRRVSEVRRDGAGEAGGEQDRGRGGELVIVLDSLPVRTLANVTLHRLEDLTLVEQDLVRRRLRAIELDLRYRDQVIARLQ